MTFFKKIGLITKIVFNRDSHNLLTIREFGHIHKDLLVIVCDPKTDRIYAMYKDKFVNGKVKAVSGKNSHVVRDVLKYSLFEKSIDGFISSVMETLHLPIFKANQFYQMIDGFLYAIAKDLRKKRQAQVIKSPYIETINK